MLAEGAEKAAADSSRLVLARARAAIAEGDQVGALALLHVLLTQGAETAASLTPVLAEALLATARAQADEQDRRALDTYQVGQAAPAEIYRMLRSASRDAEDLHTIRQALDERDRDLQAQVDQRLAEQRHDAGSAADVRRLGGWLER